jgi:hypothetical protein
LATPDVQNDVLDLLRSLPTVGTPATIVVRPPDGGTQNAFAGTPKPSKDSGIANKAVFAELVAEIADWNNDGNIRWFNVDLVVRGGRNQEEECRARMVAVRDAITDHLHVDGAKHGSFGPWVAPISGVRYVDLVVDGVDCTGPLPDDTIWWVIHARAWFDG